MTGVAKLLTVLSRVFSGPVPFSRLRCGSAVGRWVSLSFSLRSEIPPAVWWSGPQEQPQA